MVVAVLLFASFTAVADATGIDHTADGGEVADLELRDFSADGLYGSDNLVAGNHGVNGVVPLVAGLMDVGVANAAEVYGDVDVFGAGLAVFVIKRGERGGRRMCGVAVSFNHVFEVSGDGMLRGWVGIRASPLMTVVLS